MQIAMKERAKDRLPLSALLAQPLVAFTIEFDNEFEHQMPHRTTKQGKTPGARYAPWLVSMAMWFNCMRFVGEDGVTVGELERLARTTTNLAGMQRWGYITIAPDPSDSRPKPPHADWVVRATGAGRQAQAVWRRLFGVVEQRWRERFGAAQIGHLRDCLWAVADQLDVELPDCLPILGYGLVARLPRLEPRTPSPGDGLVPADLTLPALLAKVLLAFTFDFERESEISLAICADVLRLAGDAGVPVRDLPRLACVSKEAIAMALGFLEKHGYAVVEPDPASNGSKSLRLTAPGRDAREAYHRLVGDIERRWQARFGVDTLSQLRAVLERLVGDPDDGPSPLLHGLDPYPDGWRAAVRRPSSLPHYPMVLHRGGFPDGA